MKRLFLLTLMFLPLAMMAQMRIATVNVQAIFNDMPETKAASEILDNASKQYEAEYKTMQDDFNEKYAAYQVLAGNSNTPSTIIERRVRDIQDSNREIEAFLDNSQAELQKMKNDLEAPIYAKINEAIKKVGDKGGYTYIIDISTTPVVYMGPTAIDVTADVRKMLGI
ncbi:MAG: OmpH family outer membrane protein [Muribaculaceae bacterium]|nr:OmpH family outer membrane protein [Muribaculaceae bacterium]